MFFLGILFRKTELSVLVSEGLSLNYIVLFMFLMGNALTYSRNGFLSPINYIMFTYILLFIYKRKFARRLILNTEGIK